VTASSSTTQTARLLVVQHEPDTGPGWWGGALVDAGLDLVVCHPYTGEVLPPPTAYDGMLVLGGAMGPADDEACDWLPATRALLADSVAVGVPVFGICLGAELLAVACGGSVRRGIAGPELGVLDIELAPSAAEDLVLSGLTAGTRVLQWHWEEIDTLPPGAVGLASSGPYPHQAFRLGANAWGVQGHPEVTADIARAWAREDAPLLVAAGRRPDDLVGEIVAAEVELRGTWGPVAAAFATVVRDHAHAGRT